MKIHIATDHAGLEMKNLIYKYLNDQGHTLIDHGAHKYDPLDDYPDFIFPCAVAVSKDIDSRGIILGGSGQGEAIVANRIKGIRAAVYYGGPIDIIKLSRQHNNANILVLGSRLISEDEAIKCLLVFFKTEFEGGRHECRLSKFNNVDL